mgnify:CR=1 FL=1
MKIYGASTTRGGAITNVNYNTLAANDFIAFNITGSPTSVTRISIFLSGLRTG